MGTGAFLVVGGYGLDHGCGTLGSRVVVGDATAASLAATRWVYNGFGAGSREGRFDLVYETSSGSEAIALRKAGFAGAENVDLGAALAFGEFDWTGSYEAGKKSCCCGILHVDDLSCWVV